MRRPLPLAALLALAAVLALPAAASASPALPEKSTEAIFLLRHPGGLERFVRSVSDPSSPSYRHYASVESLIARFAAPKEVRSQTLAWLAARGLRGTVDATGTFVTARLPARQGERLLGGGALAGRSGPALGSVVPAGLRGAVSGVELLPGGKVFKSLEANGGNPLPGAARKKQHYSSILPHTGTAAGCAAGRAGPGAPALPPFTPNQYLKAYGHTALHDRGYEGQGQTVALVEVDGFRHRDIATFDHCFGVRTPAIRVVPVAPVRKPFSGGTETTLDLEVLSAAAPRLHRVDVFEGPGSEGGIALTAAAALGSRGHHPDVISISLGVCEPAYSEQLVYRRALDNVFAIAAGAGISVLVAAGDTGSSGCRIDNAEGETTALPIRTVSLPSSSPFVTAVGGTNLRLTAKNRIRSEIVWNDWPALIGGGGGGVSLLLPHRPWYQQLHQLDRFGIGRIVPDIAGLADVFPGYAYFCTSPECASLAQAVPGWTSIGGTSAATPLMAAGIALGDQYAARHRQRPIGFANPLLYQLGADPRTRRQVFTDVTEGNDDLGAMLPADVGGGSPLGCCSARPGYDWASGWGSPNVLALARAASLLAR
ncbi:MAG TPA: S53 family peptidase [Solirubrobacterales bacterium]